MSVRHAGGWCLILVTLSASPVGGVTRTWDPAVAAGSWRDAQNWAPPGQPEADDDVELTANGTYSVLLEPPNRFVNAEQVRSLIVGARLGEQTLNVDGGVIPLTLTADQGVQLVHGGTLIAADAIVAGEIANSGQLRMRRANLTSVNVNTGDIFVEGHSNQVSSWTANSADGRLYLLGDAQLAVGMPFAQNVLTSDGLIEFDPGTTDLGAELEVVGIAGINSFLHGDLVNFGTIGVLPANAADAVEHKFIADVINHGEFLVRESVSVEGTLINRAGGVMLFQHEDPSDGPQLSAELGVVNEALGTVRVQTSSEIVGEFENRDDGLLSVFAAPGSETEIRLTLPAEWTNDGIIDLGDPDQLAPTVDLSLETSVGPLTNGPSGELHFHAGKFGSQAVIGSVRNQGLISGSGRIEGSLENSGELAPNRLEVAGDFEQQGGELSIEVSGPTPGVDYGQITVEGDIALSGVLKISYVDNYLPPHGVPLEVVAWSGDVLFGMDKFDGETIDGLPERAVVAVNYSDDQVTVEVLYSADFDMDDDVDGDDYLAWHQNYGLTTGALPMHGDADGDGDVDEVDFHIWEMQFGMIPPTSAALPAPEPTAIGLAAMSLSWFVMRRRVKALVMGVSDCSPSRKSPSCVFVEYVL